VEGITNGFDLGVTQGEKLSPARMKVGVSSVLRDKIMDEVSRGRVMGPFKTPPVEDFQISPLLVVAKKTPGSFRLIHNLSAPRGGSVNEAIDEAKKTGLLQNIRGDRSPVKSGDIRCPSDKV
jgi:hypothetical protein